MNRLLMMGLFLLGAFMLFPCIAPAAPADCVSCDCKAMLYWRPISDGVNYGLRGTDPNDMKKTVAVPQAWPGNGSFGALYTTGCDKGSCTSTSTTYQRYTYKGDWTSVCKTPAKTDSLARVEITPTDPDDFTIAEGFTPEYQNICQE
jgi:hypothetical protein